LRTERNPTSGARRPKRWDPFNQDISSTVRNPTVHNAGASEPNRAQRWGPFNQDVLVTNRNPTIHDAGVRSTRTSRTPTGTQLSKTLGSVQTGRLGHRPEPNRPKRGPFSQDVLGTDRNPTVQNAGVRSTRTSRAPTGTQLCARLGSVQPGVSGTDRSPTVQNAGVRSTRTSWAPTGTQPSMTLGSVQPRRLGHRPDHNRRDVKGTDRNPAAQNAGLR